MTFVKSPLSQITLQFALDRDDDGGAQDVQAAIARRRQPAAPAGHAVPAHVHQKVNPADQLILLHRADLPTLPPNIGRE